MSTTVPQPNITDATALRYLTPLFLAGRQGTASDARASAVTMRRLEAKKLVREVDQEHTGRQGRPAIIYRMTDKAVKRVKRARASEQSEVQAQSA